MTFNSTVHQLETIEFEASGSCSGVSCDGKSLQNKCPPDDTNTHDIILLGRPSQHFIEKVFGESIFRNDCLGMLTGYTISHRRIETDITSSES
jgi:hypothetical protein